MLDASLALAVVLKTKMTHGCAHLSIPRERLSCQLPALGLLWGRGVENKEAGLCGGGASGNLYALESVLQGMQSRF